MKRPQNLKKSPICFDKKLFLLSSVKTSGRFFRIFVAFSEKLEFISEGARGVSKYFFLDHFSPSFLSQNLLFQELKFQSTYSSRSRLCDTASGSGFWRGKAHCFHMGVKVAVLNAISSGFECNQLKLQLNICLF